MFALVDCNNFYVSCERLFRPDLKEVPVVVASNNDGCVVARSNEVKRLGIKMGIPLFKIRDEIERHRIQVFSSNYALYANISDRVMRTLEALAPRVEIYSIDECFLDLSGCDTLTDLETLGHKIRQTIGQSVGVPVCVGIAPTKTLAKLANHAAKTYPATRGVVDLRPISRQKKLLALTETSDIWGIGRRLSQRLHALGIETALDFVQADPTLIKKHGSIQLLRTQQELKGVICHELETERPVKQQIVCSRSFSQRITTKATLHEALCDYCYRAVEKLRAEQQWAKQITLFIRTSPFSKTIKPYANSASTELAVPSDDTRDFIEQVGRLLDAIWKEGYPYAKAGIMLSHFYEPGTFQTDLFTPYQPRPHSRALMNTLDFINRSGLGKIGFAGQGLKKPWKMKRQRLSPNYTTRWGDIPGVV